MQERRVVRPGLLLAMVWGVVFVLTLYGPDVVRDEVDKSEGLREQAWLQSSLEGLEGLGQAVGLGALRDGLGRARAAINAPYTVLEYEEPEAPVEPPPPVEPTEPAAPDALEHIAPRRPRRVLVIGASSIQFAIGVELERRVPSYEGVRVKRFGQLATGLARPDFFDWPEKLDELAKSFKPDLVIANYGGNGAQAIPIGGGRKAAFKTPEWDEVYGQRVAEMVEIARRHGADMVFMGMPVMRSSSFTAKMRYLNRVQAQAARDAGAMWISTFEMAGTPDGKYRKSIEYGGKRGLMRTSDGVHYSKLGAKFVVEQVLQQIERRFRLVPREADRAVAEGHAFVSEVTSSTVAYTAYLPRETLAGTKAPAVLVLPGDDEGWNAWPGHPHRALQRLAQAHGRVLIVPKATPPGGWEAGLGKNGNTDGLEHTLLGELARDLEGSLPVSGLEAVVGSPGEVSSTLQARLTKVGIEHRAAKAEGKLAAELARLVVAPTPEAP